VVGFKELRCILGGKKEGEEELGSNNPK